MSPSIAQEPIPLVYKRIREQKHNGELVVTGESHERRLIFLRGVLKFSRTTVTGERLGEILFKLGKLNQTQFANLGKALENRKEKIGKILVESKILSQKDVFFSLLYQARSIALSLFHEAGGEWVFNEKVPDIPEDLNFNIELSSIMAEGVKKLRNYNYYSTRFKDMNPHPIPIAPENREVLSPEDMEFHARLNRFGKVSTGRLAGEMNLPGEIFWQRILILHLLGSLDFKATPPAQQPDKNVEEMLAYHDKLKANKLDFYDLLGLQRTATLQEVKDAYFSHAKRFHPDRINTPNEPELKEKANFVFATINKAYETLSNEGSRREYDRGGFKEEESAEASQESSKERARILYLKAKTLYNSKKFWEAASLLKEAVYLDSSKSTYLLLAGLAQTPIPDMRREAEKNLQKAQELDPWNAEIAVALGLLYLSENLTNRAETLFQKAISINPDHALARKKLKELGVNYGRKKGLGDLFRKKKR